MAADISSIWRVVLPTLDCLVLINLTKWFVPTFKENFFVTLKIINHTNKNKAVLPGVPGRNLCLLWERCAEKNVVNVCLNSMWWEVEGSGVLFGRDDYGNERLSYVGRVCLMLAMVPMVGRAVASRWSGPSPALSTTTTRHSLTAADTTRRWERSCHYQLLTIISCTAFVTHYGPTPCHTYRVDWQLWVCKLLIRQVSSVSLG